MIRTVMESERARAAARRARRGYSLVAVAVMVPIFVHGLWKILQWIAS